MDPRYGTFMDTVNDVQMNDMRRWQARKDKRVKKSKEHVKQCMTAHALTRAEQRNVRVRDVLEGRAKLRQRSATDGKFITIVPAQRLPNVRKQDSKTGLRYC